MILKNSWTDPRFDKSWRSPEDHLYILPLAHLARSGLAPYYLYDSSHR